MLLLAYRNLRARLARTVLTALAIALGVGMIFAMRLVAATLTESARLARESRLAGADLEITSAASAHIPLTVSETLTAQPEVELAAPLYRGLEGKAGGDGAFTMGGGALEGTGLALLGVDPARLLTPYTLGAGRFFDHTDTTAVLLPADWAATRGYAVGSTLKLTTGAQSRTYTIIGLLKPQRDQLQATPTAWLPITTLSAAFDSPNTATAIQIRLKPDHNPEAARASLQTQLGDQYVVTSAAGSSSLNSIYSIVNLALPVAGFAILLAGAFLVFNAFAITLAERRREIGQLRTLGMTRGQVMGQALLEAGLVGLFGSALGLLLGLGFGAGMVTIVRAINGEGGVAAAVLPWDAAPLAAGAGVLVTVAVTLGLARTAARVSPLEAFKPPQAAPVAHARRRLGLILLTVGLLAATAGLYAWGAEYARTALSPSYGPIFAPTLTFGAAVVALLPLWLDGLIALLERGQWLAGKLAAASLRRQGSRATVTAATLTTSFMLVIALTGLTLFMSQFLLSMNLSMFSGHVLLIRSYPPGTSLGGAAALPSLPPLPADLKADLSTLQDVAEVDYFANVAIPGIGVESGFGDQYAFALPLSIIRGKRTFPIAEGSWDEAERIFAERAPAILLPELTGRKLNKHPGDTLAIKTLQGSVTFTVAAVGGGFPIISPAAAAEYFGSYPFAIFFSPKPGVARATLEARVDALRERHRTELAKFDTEQLTATIETLIGPIQALFGGLTSLSGLVAALGIVVTLIASVLERQREIGTLRALGLKRDEVRALVVLEAGLVGFAGAALGALGGLGLAALFGQGMNTAMKAMTGASPLEGLPIPWELALASLFIGPLIAMLAALWPASRAANVDPAVAMRLEGATGFAPAAAKRRPEARRSWPRSLSLTLARRNLEQQRTRTLLSVAAITLGVSLTLGVQVLGGAVVNVVNQSEDGRTLGGGLFGQFDQLLQLMGVGVMLAASFLIFNAFAMSMTQRRQQLGTLRALGMTRGQVLRAALMEALLVGALGTLIGLVAGPLLGRAIIALVKAFSPTLNAFIVSDPPPATLALAIGLGLGAPLLAMLWPAWQAARLSPLAALKTDETAGLTRTARWPALLGLSLIVLIAAGYALSPPATWAQPPFDVVITGGISVLWLAGLALILPGAIGWLGAAARGPLTRLYGAAGQLMADNVQRARGRVLVTAATLSLALTLITAMTGAITFWSREILAPQMEALAAQGGWTVTPFDPSAGIAAYDTQKSLRLSRAAIDEIRRVFAGRATVVEMGYVVVPEVSAIGDAAFSFLITNPGELRALGPAFWRFKEGSWDTALPILERGCGVLISPGVARKNNARLGDTIQVTGRQGKVACVVAGLGQPFSSASLISGAAKNDLDPGEPFAAAVVPSTGVDGETLGPELQTIAARYGTHALRLSGVIQTITETLKALPALFSGILLLALVAAALGVVNTMLLSVVERRREFGQLRALGATRRQIMATVAGEAALIGVVGAVLGLLAGAGLTLIVALTLGGNGAGVVDFPLWPAAWRSLQASLTSGLPGTLAAPVICALAAYFPARQLVRGSAIETLKPDLAPPLRPAALLNRGSLRTRFVLGSALLLVAVLAVLVQVITQHAQGYILGQTNTLVEALLSWNTATIETAVPPDATTLDLAALQSGPVSADTLLRFRSLMDGLSQNGLTDFSLVNRDNVVVLSLQSDQIGASVAPLTDLNATRLTEAQADDGTPLLQAAAPLHNRNGGALGSLRLTLRLTDLYAFVTRVQRILWLAGGALIVLGLVVGYALTAPLTRATRALSEQAAEVRAGRFNFIAVRTTRVSLRTRLTLLMAGLVAALVGGMGVVIIPIERQEVERTVTGSLLSATRWMAEAFSEALTPPAAGAAAPDLSALLRTPRTLDLGRLQDLVTETRGDLIAYTALVNSSGAIAFSDQLSLQGEPGVTTTEARVTEARWRNQPVWVAAGPLRQGKDGAQIGSLNIGFKRASVENFLAESRTLFGLIGLSALLAGVLLAQGLGGAVAAPVEALVTQSRQVAAGDLQVQFNSGSGDELAQLAGAFNEMVAGLRERERLRDLFGRYLSREVSEAVLSGRVTLRGERKTITVMYVDMRGSTAFAEQHAPEDVMAALNEYFEVIILAVEAHSGIVNRFVGDEAVCVFGAPTEYPDHADHAVRAALAIHEGFTYVNSKRAALGQPSLRFGLGLHTGEVVAGATGSEERQEYTLIGDAMNVGARIQALTKEFPGHDLLLSESTVTALGPRAAAYPLTDLGLVELRGKSQPMRLFSLGGPAPR